MPLNAPTTAKILAIDDHEDNLALLESLLTSKGFHVLTALNGPDGLELARREHPDLILLDLAMPGMDGFEVLQHLRADPATRRMPVIVLTANYRDAGMVERGLALGATEYLTKPLQMEELVVRLRSALRLAAAERELEKLRRDMAAMLVHDMRAPLDGVRLALGTFRRQEAEGTPRRELLEASIQSLDDLGGMIEGLLLENRLEEEGLIAQRQAVSLVPFFEASRQRLQAIAEQRNLSLLFDPLTGLPAVLADPQLLQRVLDNLIGNALKFTEQGQVRVCASLADAHLRVSVSDTGPGIPVELRERIFERHFHASGNREARQKSFGLGLAFCRRAVEAMGGQLGVDSQEGHGSTFWFTLPVKE